MSTEEKSESELCIQVASDLHLEFLANPKEKQYESLINPSSPHLALLGDIGKIESPNYFNFLRWVSTKFEHVFLITGNHELYSPRKDIPYYELKQRLRTFLQENCKNIHWLDNESYELGGFLLVGSTLWSHIPKEHESDIEFCINDYYAISKGSKSIEPKDTNKWHREAVQYLETTLKKSEKPCIVLTHHAPMFGESTAPQYRGNDRRWAFCTDLTRLMSEKVKLWLFGHTHWCVDTTINSTRVVSNAKGYNTEKLKYEKDKVVVVNTSNQKEDNTKS